MAVSLKGQIAKIEAQQLRKNIPQFRVGDTVRVHAKIVEGNKERIQIFEGLVIKRHRGNELKASFTVRKVSYNVGVERTFLLHSPRIDKIEVVSQGHVRRSRLFYLRPLRGKASRIKSQMINPDNEIRLVAVEEEPGESNGESSAENGTSAPAEEAAVQEASA